MIRFACLWFILATTALAQLPPPVEKSVDFVLDIHGILSENCAECHMGGVRKGGLQMDTRRLLVQGGDSGAAIVEGDSAASRLIHLVASSDPNERMPPKGEPLTQEQIALLRAWIDQGLKWEDMQPAAEEDAYKAPLKLMQVQRPANEDGTPKPLVDAFIDQYLLDKGVQKPVPVDERLFARRAYLDVTGLLPTPWQLEDFLQSESRNKRAELVDQLLADKQAYTEHWMTFWNDHLRNDFQGTGYIDGGRSQITEWLYDALYHNKPYDSFVEELIHPRIQSEGFIKGIVWRGDNATVQLPSMQAARNVAQVFMGINLKCASCHDSFVDDWSLSDAFGLANVFSEEPMELVRCDTPLGVQAEYRFLFPELGNIDGALSRRDRMARVAELVTARGNGFFARTMVNRIWAVLMGRGLVEPLDAIEREPWHPQLLDALAQDFISNGYDLKQLLRTVMTSNAYSWPSVAHAEISGDDYVFTGPEVRRLTAEQIYDALADLADVWQVMPKFLLPEQRTPEEIARQEELAKLAAGGQSEQVSAELNTVEARREKVRAWRVPADTFMRALGRPDREQVTTRREVAFTTLQALEMTNGSALANFLRLSAESLLQQQPADIAALVKDLYVQAIQREPAEAEVQIAREILGEPLQPQGLEDFLWALAMNPEFQLIY